MIDIMRIACCNAWLRVKVRVIVHLFMIAVSKAVNLAPHRTKMLYPANSVGFVAKGREHYTWENAVISSINCWCSQVCSSLETYMIFWTWRFRSAMLVLVVSAPSLIQSTTLLWKQSLYPFTYSDLVWTYVVVQAVLTTENNGQIWVKISCPWTKASLE